MAKDEIGAAIALLRAEGYAIRKLCDAGKHKWEMNDSVILTSPLAYHRHCKVCGDVEITNDHKEWRRCFESPYSRKEVRS